MLKTKCAMRTGFIICAPKKNVTLDSADKKKIKYTHRERHIFIHKEIFAVSMLKCCVYTLNSVWIINTFHIANVTLAF